MKYQNRMKQIWRVFLQLLFLLLFLLFFSLLWARSNYGNIGMDEIIFHLNMPLKGTADNIIQSYIKRALCPAVALFLFLFVIWNWPSKYRYYLTIRTNRRSGAISLFPVRFRALPSCLFLILGFGAILVIADRSFSLFSYVDDQMHPSLFIEQEYVDPTSVALTFPEQKRNLISIYVESAETSTQDVENGGMFDVNYTPEMTQIAKDNISFSQSDLLEGAVVAPACGWTMAGLVAETSGLPLKLFDHTDRKTDNSMKYYEYFLPGVTSLGDILEANGYRTYFLAGSNFKFGGRANYFTQHGNYEAFDLITARATGKVPADYDVWWGFEDEKLYTYAREQLLEIARSDEPFHYSMLTADTHHPDGYYCELCPDIYEEQYANVWACASRQLNDFLEWLKRQDFYENTTVVIYGDHCSMDADFYGDRFYDRRNGEAIRKVYNAIVNSPVTPVRNKNRQFTTLDYFPTTLASIGVTIEGDRLALGTNLFSDRQTLSEEYGDDYLFTELRRQSSFYNKELLYP